MLTLKQIKKKLAKHQKRKTWGDDYTGPHTTSEENEAYLMVEILLKKLETTVQSPPALLPRKRNGIYEQKANYV